MLEFRNIFSEKILENIFRKRKQYMYFEKGSFQKFSYFSENEKNVSGREGRIVVKTASVILICPERLTSSFLNWSSKLFKSSSPAIPEKVWCASRPRAVRVMVFVAANCDMSRKTLVSMDADACAPLFFQLSQECSCASEAVRP